MMVPFLFGAILVLKSVLTGSCLYLTEYPKMLWLSAFKQYSTEIVLVM